MAHGTNYCFEETPFRKKIFSPLKNIGYVPEKNSQLFVSRIPKTATVHDLLKFFEPIGELFQIKLMCTSDGINNRGFAYVTYMNKQLAAKAMQILNSKEFIDSSHSMTHLSIQYSADNCRIFLGGLPVTKTKDEIWHALTTTYQVDNLVDVISYRNYSNPTHNRGFVFLEFRTHEEASYFRAKHWKNMVLFGKKLLVDWSIPVLETEADMKKVKILFIRNIDVTQTSEEFAKSIYALMDRRYIEKVYKFKDYAYVHLISREEAEKLMKILREYYGDMWEICFAKPPNKFTDRTFRDKALISRRSSSMRSSIPSPTPIEIPSPTPIESPPSTSFQYPPPSSSYGSPTSSNESELLSHQLSQNTLQCLDIQNKLKELVSQRNFLQSRLNIAASPVSTDYGTSISNSSGQSISPACFYGASSAPAPAPGPSNFIPFQARAVRRPVPLQGRPSNFVDLENMVDKLLREP